jgi:hypothetical protein
VVGSWGLAGSILALETLKLALAPLNRARNILVGQALQAGLVPLLLGKLDWRKAGSGSSRGEEEVRDMSFAAFGVRSVEIYNARMDTTMGEGRYETAD